MGRLEVREAAGREKGSGGKHSESGVFSRIQREWRKCGAKLRRRTARYISKLRTEKKCVAYLVFE
jgi:hypothetical protein